MPGSPSYANRVGRQLARRQCGIEPFKPLPMPPRHPARVARNEHSGACQQCYEARRGEHFLTDLCEEGLKLRDAAHAAPMFEEKPRVA